MRTQAARIAAFAVHAFPYASGWTWTQTSTRARTHTHTLSLSHSLSLPRSLRLHSSPHLPYTRFRMAGVGQKHFSSVPRFSKVLCIVPLNSTCTEALTFQNFLKQALSSLLLTLYVCLICMPYMYHRLYPLCY